VTQKIMETKSNTICWQTSLQLSGQFDQMRAIC
jgi:hypothetical protein